MHRLEGKRVAITGPRRSEELSKLVLKQGGIPIVRPAQGTLILQDPDIEAQVADFIHGKADWMILTTGIGVESLCQNAESVGMREPFIAKLKSIQIAARGYKTVNALKSLGIEPTVRDDDGTTSGLIRALSSFDLSGKRVVVQFYGDTIPQLTEWLEEQGALFAEVLPYQHVPPDQVILKTLISEICHTEVDAVVFTSTSQVRYTLACASENGMLEQVIHAFAGPVVAATVGKVTAQALRENGIERIVSPEVERMGSMIISLADYYMTEAKRAGEV